MKFNLKNRPQYRHKENCAVCAVSNEWFEAFEKELRKRLQKINHPSKETLMKTTIDELLEKSLNEYSKLVKEILGE